MFVKLGQQAHREERHGVVRPRRVERLYEMVYEMQTGACRLDGVTVTASEVQGVRGQLGGGGWRLRGDN